MPRGVRYGWPGSMPLSVKPKGLFGPSLSPSLLSFETSCFLGSCTAAAGGSCPAGDGLGLDAGTENHCCSLSAASRTEQRSITATKPSAFPPRRPPRAATHDCDWHAQAPPVPLLNVAVKLSLLSFELCVGSGHLPRSEPTPTRRKFNPYRSSAICSVTALLISSKLTHSICVPPIMTLKTAPVILRQPLSLSNAMGYGSHQAVCVDSIDYTCYVLWTFY